MPQKPNTKQENHSGLVVKHMFLADKTVIEAWVQILPRCVHTADSFDWFIIKSHAGEQ